MFGPFFRVERYPFVLFCSALFVSQVLIFYEQFFCHMSACFLYDYWNSLILVCHKGSILNCNHVVCIFSLIFYFWVTLPSATHLIICVSPNGGKLKQNRVLVLPVNNVLLCWLSIMVLPENGQFFKSKVFCRFFSRNVVFYLVHCDREKKVRCVRIDLLMCTTSYPPYMS